MSKTAKNGEHAVIPTDASETVAEKANLDGDRLNCCLLVTLYIIQGFIIGFSIGLQIILQSRKTVTYEDQAIFSITLWPFMLKILWAPLVDSLYVQRIGKRKSWLIPLQLLMVTLMLYLANNMDRWIPESEKPNLKMLAIVVLALNFLAATQDIVVDGWSLTMLKKKNVSYSSTCNNVGVSTGIFIGSVLFTLMVSEQFNNQYFRKTPGSGGLISMKTFLYLWIAVVLTVTFLIAAFKSDVRSRRRAEDDYKKISVCQNYKLLWDVLRLPGIKVLAIALLTTKIGFIATESVSPLKLIDAGLSKDDISITNALMYVVKIFLPTLVSKYVTSPHPMKIYVNMMPYKLLWGIVYAVFVYFTPSLIKSHGVIDVPVYYYAILGFVLLTNEMLACFMMVILYAFFCKISDPRFGGTYMTLFNTFYFIGWLAPNTLVLKLVDQLTFSRCSVDVVQNVCAAQHLKDACSASGLSCETYVDGYYITMGICTIIGFVWYGVFRNVINKYQSLGLFSYKAHNLRPNTEQAYEVYISVTPSV